jgi:molybdopterin/thiamine biosynthesis adenylyltransferase
MAQLTKQELRRYQPQIILPGIGQTGQEKIGDSKVLVIGAGGLGTPVMQYLTAAGIGRLGIVDNGMIDITNLQRQVLYGIEDIGKLKTVVSRDRLKKQNHMVDFKLYNLRISGGNIMKILKDYDLVIDCTDNFQTRYIIDDACVATGKTWIFGGIYGYEGQVSVFNHQKGPALRHLFPDIPEEDTPLSPEQAGILGVLPGIIGCYQTAEAIKIITGSDAVLSGKILMINVLKNTHTIYSFTGNGTGPR